MIKMNKKAYTLTAVIIMTILVLSLIMLLFIFFAPAGMLGKAADIGEDISDKYLPEKDTKVFESDVETDEKVSDSFDKFIAVWKDAAKNKDSKECIVYYDEFPGLKGNKIHIEDTDKGILISLMNEKGQLIRPTSIEDLNVCAVGGKTTISKNFYDKFMNKISVPTANTYSEGNFIIIYKSEKFEFKTQEGKTEIWKMSDKGAEENSKKVNVLYKADENHICIIPTKSGAWSRWGCDGDKLLDNDCIQEMIDGKHHIKKC